MKLSVTDPVGRAWDRMAEVLFRPFDIGKWFGLGFCVFLANLGRGGGSVNFPSGGGGGTPAPPSTPTPSTPTPGQSPTWLPSTSPSGTPSGGMSGGASGGMSGGASGGTSGGASGGGDLDELWRISDTVIQWVKDHAVASIVLAAAGFLFMTAIWGVFLWLRSRGVFMVIDNLAFNRGQVVDPWRNTSKYGNSLFKFEFVVGLAVTVIMLLTTAAAGYVAWPDIVNHTVGANMLWAFVILVMVLPLTLVNYGIMQMLLVDFIAPTMYLHDLRTVPAWGKWYREIFKGHFWKLTLFYLMYIVLGIAAAVVMMIATCLTCCIAALPYLGTVILLPVFVFMRCYSLCFIEQFGESWRIFIYDDGRIPCPACGYDLRGNPHATHCPECGNPTPIEQDLGPEPWET